MTETENQAWTIQRLLQWTTDFFKQRGLDSPRLAAEVLLAESLGCPRIQLYARFAEVPAEPALGRFRDWVKRHAVGEPVAYLVGFREFYSLRFMVDKSVLIPRPETEQLVLLAIDRLRAFPMDARTVIDVGTGSGCIAITLAKNVAGARVMALDVSPDALKIAKKNVAEHQVGEQVSLQESDLFSSVPTGTQVSMIVSNPPYVGRNEIGLLEDNVRRYEPELALYGGETGLELTEDLVLDAVRYLRPGGWLLFETSPMLAGGALALIQKNEAFDRCEIQKDLSRLDRMVVAQKK